MLINKSINQSINQSTNQSINGSSGGASVPNMQDIIPSANFDVDATVEASYGGSGQTFANLVVAPADGVASQTDYDFNLGADSGSSTDDPTFTGSAGDSGAYFLHDGGDFFRLAAANTAWLENLFKDMSGTSSGTTGWFSAAIHVGTLGFYRVGGVGKSNTYNGVDFTSQTGTDEIGMDFRAATSGNFATNDSPITAIGDYLITWTWDFSIATPVINIYVGSTLRSSATVLTTEGTTTNGTENRMELQRSDNTLPAKADARTYGFSMGQDFIDGTAVAAIAAEYGTRHGRSYT